MHWLAFWSAGAERTDEDMDMHNVHGALAGWIGGNRVR